MKNRLLIVMSLLPIALGVAGCSKSDEENMDINTKNMQDAASDASKNAVSALELTPMVKAAIIANSTLNDPRNNINVESKDNVVKLTGHVYSQQLKNLAEKVAQKVLDENKSTDTVSNELTVSPG